MTDTEHQQSTIVKRAEASDYGADKHLATPTNVSQPRPVSPSGGGPGHADFSRGILVRGRAYDLSSAVLPSESVDPSAGG